MKNLLTEAIHSIKNLAENEKVTVKGGKKYTQVATRVEILRNAYADTAQIVTEVVEMNQQYVCMKATISVLQDRQWSVVSTGHAEEYRASSNVNKTSALENCETSAIGRALAAMGIHGGEFASSFEVDNAIHNKPDVVALTAEQDLENYQAACDELIDSITQIKEGINDNDLKFAAIAWFELTDDEKTAIWRAPTKGGCFTVQERKMIASSEFRKIYYGTGETETETETSIN
tara:strand:- start:11 stop:706 length:696 start_codon:yes stop_codon:yes gene_type:complete